MSDRRWTTHTEPVSRSASADMVEWLESAPECDSPLLCDTAHNIPDIPIRSKRSVRRAKRQRFLPTRVPATTDYTTTYTRREKTRKQPLTYSFDEFDAELDKDIGTVVQRLVSILSRLETQSWYWDIASTLDLHRLMKVAKVGLINDSETLCTRCMDIAVDVLTRTNVEKDSDCLMSAQLALAVASSACFRSHASSYISRLRAALQLSESKSRNARVVEAIRTVIDACAAVDADDSLIAEFRSGLCEQRVESSVQQLQVHAATSTDCGLRVAMTSDWSVFTIGQHYWSNTDVMHDWLQLCVLLVASLNENCRVLPDNIFHRFIPQLFAPTVPEISRSLVWEIIANYSSPFTRILRPPPSLSVINRHLRCLFSEYKHTQTALAQRVDRWSCSLDSRDYDEEYAALFGAWQRNRKNECMIMACIGKLLPLPAVATVCVFVQPCISMSA